MVVKLRRLRRFREVEEGLDRHFGFAQ